MSCKFHYPVTVKTFVSVSVSVFNINLPPAEANPETMPCLHKKQFLELSRKRNIELIISTLGDPRTDFCAGIQKEKRSKPEGVRVG